MKIFVSIPKETEVFRTFIEEGVQRYLEKNADIKYSAYEGQVRPEQFTKEVMDCDAVITGWGHPAITPDMVKGTALKVILHTGGSVGSLITPDL